MGLDITAVRRAKLEHAPTIGDGGHDHYPDEVRYVYANPDFPGREDGLTNGCYSYASSFGFRAGSYGGYNWWRDRLALFAYGVKANALWCDPSNEGRAFWELINFADNEGVIGPKTSAKLIGDFKRSAEAAEIYATTLGGDGAYWIEKYREWAKAFYIASDDGFVSFH